MLRELAWLFLKLGTTAFGGPAAHVAMMEREVVGKRGWLTREEFLDLVSAANLIPGPNSTELAIHIGHKRAGWRGLVVAGACFILPAALIVGAIAWAYARYGMLPAVGNAMRGIEPVIIAIVAQALWRFVRTTIKSAWMAALGVAAIAAALAGVHELAILGLAGCLVALARRPRAPGSAASFAPFALAPAAVAGAGAATLPGLFLVFLKIGSVLFGSGYVLVAFMRSDLVERLHWLTEPQLLDAIAVGQVTPGPVFTTATFVGYVLGGGGGAVVATLGIFLPAFVFVAASAPLLPRLRASPIARAVLDGLNVASIGLMAAVAIQLARIAIVDVPTGAIGATAAVLLVRFDVNSAWLVLGGAIVGTLLGYR